MNMVSVGDEDAAGMLLNKRSAEIMLVFKGYMGPITGDDRPVTATDIQQLVGGTYGYIAERLRDFESVGWVERLPQQGRRKPYKLTDAGRAVAQGVETIINAAEASE